MDDVIASLSSYFGIEKQFTDLAGSVHPASTETQLALLQANGVDVSSTAVMREYRDDLVRQADARELPLDLVIPCNQSYTRALTRPGHWQIRGCDQPLLQLDGRATDRLALPALPCGVYDLTFSTTSSRESVTVLATPGSSPALQDVQSRNQVWGVNAALYGLRSERNLGVGDYADLAQLCTQIGSSGASFVGLNPVHALGSNVPDIISPYSPSHRGLLETGYIALDGIPGLEKNEFAQSIHHQTLELTRSKSTGELIDYALQRQALSAGLTKLYELFNRLAPDSIKHQFACFKLESNQSLQDFVLYESLSQRYGADWRAWPTTLRGRDAGTLESYRLECQSEIDFQYWMQWVAERQLQGTAALARSGGLSIGLYLDFAVGARRSGAESWCEMDSCAEGVSIGAPPDHLSPAGQNWQLSGFSAHKLQSRQYRPYQLMLRSVMRHARMLRIDHVLGLNRIFWIPDNGAAGGYVQQPLDSLLAVIKIEAQRAGTIIIGEDLGLVPDGFRDTMRDAGFYGYSVLQYEKTTNGNFNNPADNARQTLACFSTHDTPTIAGFTSARDIHWWQQLGWVDSSRAERSLQERDLDVEALLGLDSMDKPGNDQTALCRTMKSAMHRLLAKSNSALVAVQLDDILGLDEAQNLPGTTTEHPNWRRRYSLAVNQLSCHDDLQSTAEIMNNEDRGRRDPFAAETPSE